MMPTNTTVLGSVSNCLVFRQEHDTSVVFKHCCRANIFGIGISSFNNIMMNLTSIAHIDAAMYSASVLLKVTDKAESSNCG
eukprot:scaffold6952_cov69-Cylindrotheca_fusiformis.AAC.2